jgi:hypothetical protein
MREDVENEEKEKKDGTLCHTDTEKFSAIDQTQHDE